jgi:hypothetical protein
METQTTISAPQRALASRLRATAIAPTTARSTHGASTTMPFEGVKRVVQKQWALGPTMPMKPRRVEVSTEKL